LEDPFGSFNIDSFVFLSSFVTNEFDQHGLFDIEINFLSFSLEKLSESHWLYQFSK